MRFKKTKILISIGLVSTTFLITPLLASCFAFPKTPSLSPVIEPKKPEVKAEKPESKPTVSESKPNEKNVEFENESDGNFNTGFAFEIDNFINYDLHNLNYWTLGYTVNKYTYYKATKAIIDINGNQIESNLKDDHILIPFNLLKPNSDYKLKIIFYDEAGSRLSEQIVTDITTPPLDLIATNTIEKTISFNETEQKWHFNFPFAYSFLDINYTYRAVLKEGEGAQKIIDSEPVILVNNTLDFTFTKDQLSPNTKYYLIDLKISTSQEDETRIDQYQLGQNYSLTTDLLNELSNPNTNNLSGDSDGDSISSKPVDEAKHKGENKPVPQAVELNYLKNFDFSYDVNKGWIFLPIFSQTDFSFFSFSYRNSNNETKETKIIPVHNRLDSYELGIMLDNENYELTKIDYYNADQELIGNQNLENITFSNELLFLNSEMQISPTKRYLIQQESQWILNTDLYFGPLTKKINNPITIQLELIDANRQIHKSELVTLETLSSSQEISFVFNDLTPNTRYLVTEYKINYQDKNLEDLITAQTRNYTVATPNQLQTFELETINIDNSDINNKALLQLQFRNLKNKYIVVYLNTLKKDGTEEFVRARSNPFYVNENGLATYRFNYHTNQEYYYYATMVFDNEEAAKRYQQQGLLEEKYQVVYQQENKLISVNEQQLNLEFSQWTPTGFDYSNNFILSFRTSTTDHIGYQLEIIEVNHPDKIYYSSIVDASNQIVRAQISGLEINKNYQVQKVNIFNIADHQIKQKFFSVSYPFTISETSVNNDANENAIRLLKQNLKNDSRSLAKFIRDRSFRINYPGEIYELYGERNPYHAQTHLITTGSMNSGTGWVLDKDLSDPSGMTYYIATNLHVVAQLAYPLIISNNEKTLSNPNLNTRRLNEEDRNRLGSDYNIFNFSYSGTDRLPFSALWKNHISIYTPSTDSNWNTRERFQAQNNSVDLFRYYVRSYLNYRYIDQKRFDELGLANEDNNIISFEILDPYIVDYVRKEYKDYRNTEDYVVTKTISNAGVDMAIVKVKLNPRLPKPPAFVEYDKLPTLVAALKTDDLGNRSEEISIYGYSRMQDGNIPYDQAASFTGISNRYYNPSLFTYNKAFGEYRVPKEYSKYAFYYDTFINVAYNLHNTQEERQNLKKLVAAITENNFYMIPSPDQPLSTFHRGSSGSMVINKDKELVGIFYAGSTDQNNVYALWQSLDYNKSWSPIAHYLSTRTAENSWLKKYWSAIKKLDQ
ncbi:DUF31 family protein [Ureaplasma sp. ES3154-GEN]|uniref:DUF31 family protein n=1 Tax=Ureaplasma sp. ES3154-GEN TaxID=2984844 RepID=UPI0021E7ED10|nr:DUF31 family protein [Ureaplasma sp. ES3154-GEN]MCV3743448.1 DUF31 family protein [Ureaplasma sp. ES3154-GEN]